MIKQNIQHQLVRMQGAMDDREFRQFVANEEAELAKARAAKVTEMQKKFAIKTAPFQA